MFEKILVANRGEIACRVMKTAKRMGIGTVAVYSEADRDALHVAMADEAVAIGPAPSAESYLVAERIVGACKETGADAVHPGYGFLSENTAFAETLADAGIAFIGPPPAAIAAMGDKIESKRIAKDAGVNTIPGHVAVIRDEAEALEIAQGIGFPVMIKASAGGGGKGMRIARAADEMAEGFRLATNEARSSFADDRVFIEKFIEDPRHIEIQVLADTHGGAVYLNERECSIQRRHQKVIEEAPSPFLDAATRRAMGEQAVALANRVAYCSAGTVEFIVDKDRNFYFLEMNTRLQVEHPVTELITGLDLVEQMIRVAAGEKLAFGQDDVTLTGWAMESRVYAEDPLRGFLPSVGRLVRYIPPEESETVRVDTGVGEGSEISIYYDPMIAKLVSYGATRDEAIAEMRRALDGYYVRGVSHNMQFLSAVMQHPRFVAGDLTTGFIEEEFPDGFKGVAPGEAETGTLAAIAAAAAQIVRERERSVGCEEPATEDASHWTVQLGPDYIDVALEGEPGDVLVIIGAASTDSADRRPAIPVLTGWRPGEPLFRAQVGGAQVIAQIDATGTGWRIAQGGTAVEARVLRPRVAQLAATMPVKEPPDMSKFLLSPMPGLLVSVAVAGGQWVKAGEELAVIEAMKMENVLRADQDGEVKAIHASPGDSLTVDQKIVEFV
ncbi:MAG: acetyl/propionyl/methylcrotonyl-CoA carboxylase subunit alpha [Rhodospirillaceae bacterium]|nr:acetyl/propionyl/methylcrotonyl-CoA carboxylase subunit alpha [Rhodospirillaceae bacterium]